MALIVFAAAGHGFGHANPIAGWNSANGDLNPSEGVSIEVRVGDKRRFFTPKLIDTSEPEQNRCAALTADNRCAVHLGKKLLHRAWPMAPSQVTPFSECTYTFTEIGRWKISELTEATDV